MLRRCSVVRVEQNRFEETWNADGSDTDGKRMTVVVVAFEDTIAIKVVTAWRAMPRRRQRCGRTVQAVVLPAYETDLGGVRVRLVNAAIRETCSACAEATIEIPDLDGLARAAAMVRALLPLQLTGKDVRFLRRALDMNGRAFAEAMGLTPETVSRWENGERGIGGSNQKLSRHNICALLHKDTPAIIYDPADITRMRILNAPEDFALPPLAFRRVVVKDRWEVAEAWDRLPLAACAVA